MRMFQAKISVTDTIFSILRIFSKNSFDKNKYLPI